MISSLSFQLLYQSWSSSYRDKGAAWEYGGLRCCPVMHVCALLHLPIRFRGMAERVWWVHSNTLPEAELHQQAHHTRTLDAAADQ